MPAAFTPCRIEVIPSVTAPSSSCAPPATRRRASFRVCRASVARRKALMRAERRRRPRAQNDENRPTGRDTARWSLSYVVRSRRERPTRRTAARRHHAAQAYRPHAHQRPAQQRPSCRFARNAHICPARRPNAEPKQMLLRHVCNVRVHCMRTDIGRR